MSQDNNGHETEPSNNNSEGAAESAAVKSAMTVVETASGEEVQITIEDEELVARGGWATVSKAKLVPNGEVLAVKRIKETSQYKVSILNVSQLTVAPRDGDSSRVAAKR